MRAGCHSTAAAGDVSGWAGGRKQETGAESHRRSWAEVAATGEAGGGDWRRERQEAATGDRRGRRRRRPATGEAGRRARGQARARRRRRGARVAATARSARGSWAAWRRDLVNLGSGVAARATRHD